MVLSAKARTPPRSSGLVRRRHAVRVAPVALLAVLALVAAGCDIGPWHETGSEKLDPVMQSQGIATVIHPDNTTTRVYDGIGSVPSDISAAGYNHVGDPDSSEGYIFRAHQNASSAAGTKLFRATTPDGTNYDYVHSFSPGSEEYNNSFAAVSPDGQWLVSGEWDAMTRFLVFPTPILNPATSPTGGTLPLAATIHLDKTLVDIQGCTFENDTRMMCSSDDPIAENGFPRKSLFQVDLDRALDGGSVNGTVTLVGQVPLISGCAITKPGSWPDDFEVEGVDFDRVHRQLRVVVIPPGNCVIDHTVAYVFGEPTIG